VAIFYGLLYNLRPHRAAAKQGYRSIFWAAIKSKCLPHFYKKNYPRGYSPLTLMPSPFAKIGGIGNLLAT